MAEIEDARHANPVARPPTNPKVPYGEIDEALGGKKPGLVSRKLGEYRRKVRECQKSRHALERAIICAVAVGLLWLTCLAMCQAIVYYFIRAPATEDVVSAAKQSMDYTEASRNDYETCANRVTRQCTIKIENLLNDQTALVQQKQLSNRLTLEQLYVIRDKCNEELNYSITILAWLQQFANVTNPKDKFPTNSSTTDPRCLLVDEMLKGGQGGMQALGTTDRYVNDADAQVASTSSALDSRAAYDAAYTLNKTQGIAAAVNATIGPLNFTFGNLTDTYDLYLACVSPTSTYNGKVCPTVSILGQVQQMQDRAQQRYNQLEATVNQWKARAESVTATIKSFYTALTSNALLRAAIDVLLVLQGLPTLAAMGLFGFDGGDFTFESLLGLIFKPTPSQMWADFQAQSAAYLASIQAQQEQAARNQADLLSKQLAFGGSNPLPGYNPPPVNTTATRNAWKSQKDPAVQQMAKTLDGSLAEGDDQTSVFQGDPTSLDPKNFESNYLDNVNRRVWDKFYVYTGLDVEKLMQAWQQLIGTALIFDYLFRVFRTLQIIRKYWRVSALSLPPADVRTDHMQSKGLSYGNRNTAQKLAACIAHPATACITLSAMAAAIIVLLISLYLPLYKNFIRGCINNQIVCKSNATNAYDFGPGTMISNNAYGISYSYAASEGDKVTTVEVDKVNGRKEIVCNRELDRSQQIMNNDDREWNFIRNSHRDLQYQAFALRDCINVTAVDAFNATAPSQATANNVTHLRDVLPGGHCSVFFETLPRALFNCSDITCSTKEVLCKKVDKDTMIVNTWKASCFSEWYVHATFLGSIMVTTVYILTNCSRIFTMRGLVRVFWRYLTDGRFSYLGTCERTGDLRYPSIITVQGYSMKRAVRESLAMRLRWWESKSYLILLFGLGANIPCIVILVYLNETFTTKNPQKRLEEFCV